MMKYFRQICEKSDHNQRSRQFEEEQQKRHFESWETFWGRPGYGAPKPNTTKGNLMKMLHFPEKVAMAPKLLVHPFSSYLSLGHTINYLTSH